MSQILELSEILEIYWKLENAFHNIVETLLSNPDYVQTDDNPDTQESSVNDLIQWMPYFIGKFWFLEEAINMDCATPIWFNHTKAIQGQKC